ncbi:MAG: hypothetical protein ABR987_21840, partial [Terracidiphilus sp.]
MKILRIVAVLPVLAAFLCVLCRPLASMDAEAAKPEPASPAIRATTAPTAQVDHPPATEPTVPETWSHDVAPVLYAHCTTCHHPGGAGPFSLLTYADARRWAPQILSVTQSRFMPPWLPEPGYGDFA